MRRLWRPTTIRGSCFEGGTVDELSKILAKAMSGLMEWAPNQLAPLMAMKQTEFAIVLPITGLLAVVGLVLMVLGLWVLDFSVYSPVWLWAMVFLGCILFLVAGPIWLSYIVELRTFTTTPELYVLKELLSK